MSVSEPSAGSELHAVRLLLDRLGLTPEQLFTQTPRPTAVPTFDEYIAKVSMAVSDGTRRLYDTYWRKIGAEWGSRRIDEPTPLEIKQLAERVKQNVVIRRNTRGGRSAAEHLISAIRCLYQQAVADRLISAADDPAARVPKPRRLASTRRALPDGRLAEIVEVPGSTGNDPHLDALILRLHLETACRRGGALALRLTDLDPAQSLIRLREKGETVRWQPVTPTLMQALLDHCSDRGGHEPTDQVLRYRNGRPITRRRYDYLWERLGRHLPWVATQQVSIHWLRHTTLTWVERHFGYAVARAYAGHNTGRDIGVTATYVRADIQEVAEALAALTGEPHPLGRSADSASGEIMVPEGSSMVSGPGAN
ncbi:site-specific integrase [Paractinoplanes atraurantiacus]|uniref:Site-specific recombinase XerC n=1 Tax=Paractinoplanes atraurantiacus TaxID=1036182 RepID=A0A285GQB0_9ACTN|nr:tyrosine-type recombinase/integrase [Actinoplanes atraurantiacus]SNY25742.1 Site-specific recombinase XerC [Actinoplanes atraurantiacus]